MPCASRGGGASATDVSGGSAGRRATLSGAPPSTPVIGVRPAGGALRRRGPGTARASYRGLIASPPMARVLLVLQEDTLGGSTRTLLRPVEVLLERGWE